MKRMIMMLVIASLCQVYAFGQKKYEMVIEKTDGTEVVLNVEDVKRTYFRVRDDGGTDTPSNPNSNNSIDIVGTWYCYENDQPGIDSKWTFNADGTGIYSGDGGQSNIGYTFSNNVLTFWFEGEEDDPGSMAITVVSSTEFTYTEGGDGLTFKKQV